MEKLFFELIRVAIGRQEVLSRTPTAQEWEELYAMAKKHSIVGICYNGIRRLREEAPDICAMLEKTLRLKWLAMVTRIQDRNALLNAQCVMLQRRFGEDGFKTSILKGQGIATYYGDMALYRQSGDIDIWIDATIGETMRYVRKVCSGKCDFDIKHVAIPVQKGVEVEVHWCAEHLMSLRANHKLQKYWASHKNDFLSGLCHLPQDKGEIVTPSIALNRFYILLHCYRHFIEGGIGLRQIMDYYFVLQQEYQGDDMGELVQSFGMMRFAKAVMWLLGEVLGLEREKMLCEPDEKEGRFLLDEIIQTGNFGHGDTRIKAIGSTRRMRVLSNVLQHGSHLIAHYPQEVLWTPVWFVYHYIWKRMWMYRNNYKQ